MTTRQDLVIEAINTFEHRPFTLTDIRGLIPEIPRGTVSGVLTVLKHKNLVFSEGRGLWRSVNYHTTGEKLDKIPDPPNPTPATVEDLSLSDLKLVLDFFLEDYVKSKRDTRDLHNMLNTFARKCSAAVSIPIQYILNKEEK